MGGRGERGTLTCHPEEATARYYAVTTWLGCDTCVPMVACPYMCTPCHTGSWQVQGLCCATWSTHPSARCENMPPFLNARSGRRSQERPRPQPLECFPHLGHYSRPLLHLVTAGAGARVGRARSALERRDAHPILPFLIMLSQQYVTLRRPGSKAWCEARKSCRPLDAVHVVARGGRTQRIHINDKLKLRQEQQM